MKARTGMISSRFRTMRAVEARVPLSASHLLVDVAAEAMDLDPRNDVAFEQAIRSRPSTTLFVIAAIATTARAGKTVVAFESAGPLATSPIVARRDLVRSSITAP